MTDKELAKKVFHLMYDNDPFSKWLGIELIEIDKGFCKLKMKVRKEMLNGFNIMHGGISYSLADSAFAFASNSDGIMSVTVTSNMSYPNSVNINDTLIAEAKIISQSKKNNVLDVTICNQKDEIVGLFRGTAYRTSIHWLDKNKGNDEK